MNIHKLTVQILKHNHVASILNRFCCSLEAKPLLPVVTVTNATSSVGRNIAFLLKQSPFVHELRLHDCNDDIFHIAEDISHIDTKTKIRSYKGEKSLKCAIENAHIILQVGGSPTKPCVSMKNLFDLNLDSVRNTAIYTAEFNPKAIFCIQTPPIECFVPLVSEEYKKAGVYDKKKIIGLTSTAAMRANWFVGNATGRDPTDILLPIIGGLSPWTTVAVLSQTQPKVRIPKPTLAMLQKSIAEAEDNILKLFKEPTTICLSEAIGVCRFVNNLLKALLGETNCVDCAFVGQMGHIESFLPYMTTIVRLGRHGVVSTHMPKISDQEAYLLKKAALFLRSSIHIGESFISGKNYPENETCQLIAPKKIENAEEPEPIPEKQCIKSK